MVFFAVMGVSTAGVNTLMWALEADTVEYGEWKTGVRTEGITYALFSFTRKFGQAVGGAMAAYVIAFGGYVGGAVAQSESAAERHPLRRRIRSRRVHPGRHRALLPVPAHRADVHPDGRRDRRAPRRAGGGRAQQHDWRPDMTAGTSTPPVVTLFESYGAGAGHVGPRVAQALGVPFHAQAFSSEEIESGESEREGEGLLSRVLSVMGGSYAALGSGDEGHQVAHAQQDRYELVMANTRLVREEAGHGGVITGRNGALILADWPGALHVLLDGPVEQRIERAAKERGIDVARAAKRQKREDQIRADMSIQLYGWDPRETTRYHLMVNTGLMDLDTCVDVIVQAARVRAELRSAPSR